jgi:hypothetical protein
MDSAATWVDAALESDMSDEKLADSPIVRTMNDSVSGDLANRHSQVAIGQTVTIGQTVAIPWDIVSEPVQEMENDHPFTEASQIAL